MTNRTQKTQALDQALYGFLEELDGGKNLNIIGIDEVGRGSLAGPLTVGAVVLPLKLRISGLNDSKKLSALRREALAREIIEIANEYSIIDIEAAEVDRLGIAKALRLAMTLAVAKITKASYDPDIVLIDGKPLHIHPREQAIIKGDGKVASIAAASIIAKVHRDALMVEHAGEFPNYQWQSNKGYGSAAHIAAIGQYGLSPLHRRSFCAKICQASLF